MFRVFKNRVLRRTFDPRRDNVTGEWRILHNKELYALYSSPDMIRVIKSRRQMGRTCSTYGGKERCIQGFSGGNLRKGATWKTQAWMGG
jgi:hypothetical protein